VFVPNGDWHLRASDAGADVLSPNGSSDASLGTWYSTTAPWTMQTLADQILSGVSGIDVVCNTPVETSATGSSQLVELTGTYQSVRIHAVIALSILRQTTSTSIGETRSVYTPVGAWSASAAQTLWLIVKRAIPIPQEP